MTVFSGTHRVSFDAIRALAIECHALDLSAYTLLVDGTHQPSRSTKITYEELLTSKLLLLAIALRTKFYQGVPHAETAKYVIDCGFLDSTTKGIEISHSFTIKDICDKIIHAEGVKRDLVDGNNGLITTLEGTQGKSAWKLHLSMSLLTEAVLNWIDEKTET